MSAKEWRIIILAVFTIIVLACQIWQRKTESAVPLVVWGVSLLVASILIFIV